MFSSSRPRTDRLKKKVDGREIRLQEGLTWSNVYKKNKTTDDSCGKQSAGDVLLSSKEPTERLEEIISEGDV